MDDSIDAPLAQHHDIPLAVHTVSSAASVVARIVADLLCRQLALVVLLHTDTWQSRRGMIEYNLTFLRQGIRRILMEV